MRVGSHMLTTCRICRGSHGLDQTCEWGITHIKKQKKKNIPWGCTTLWCNIRRCITRRCNTRRCNTLQRVAHATLWCNRFQCVAVCCSVLQRQPYPTPCTVFCAMGWLRLVGSFKSWVCFAKEPYKRDDILQKRTYNFKEPTNRSHPICKWGSFDITTLWCNEQVPRSLPHKKPIYVRLFCKSKPGILGGVLFWYFLLPPHNWWIPIAFHKRLLSRFRKNDLGNCWFYWY